MNYEEALDFIHHRVRRNNYTGEAGLQHMREFMHRLGDPQKALRFVHIAGSNGKGSTAAMCESVLRQAGYHTGLFLSPFIFDFRERIQIDGALVEKELMAETLTEMLPALDEACTEFETVTALAFCIFAKVKAQVVVLEVGIGGLLDCTNIIDPPLAAAVCSISLEHTELLGTTIPEIAAQKCGILKAGSRAAGYCDLVPEAQRVLQETCERLSVPLYQKKLSDVRVDRSGDCGTDFTLEGVRYSIPLAGEHQLCNALTVLALTDALRDAGLDLPQTAVVQGLADTEIVGRLQIVRREPVCILDGAHNPGKIGALCAALDALYPGKKIVSVLGMMRRKDYHAAIPLIASRSKTVIAVPAAESSELSVPPEETAELAKACCSDVRICRNAAEGARLALSLAGKEDVAVACGSMYLLSDAKAGFLDGN